MKFDVSIKCARYQLWSLSATVETPFWEDGGYDFRLYNLYLQVPGLILTRGSLPPV